MVQFIIRRLAYGILVVLGVIFVVFMLFHALPGDPVSVMMGNKGDSTTRKEIIKDLGLDKPLPVQLMYYLNDLSPLAIHTDNEKNQEKYDYLKIIPAGEMALVVKTPYLRRSYQTKRKVSEILWEDIEGTLILAFVSMFFATIIGVCIGVVAALNQNNVVDYSLVTLSVLGISTPSFVLAILMSVVFGHYLKDYTGLNAVGALWEDDGIHGLRMEWKNLILPATTLAMRPLAIIVQLTRSSMLEVMSQDYIRTAKAKGVAFFNLITGHALKNALNPVVTAVSGWLASLLAGAFFIEYIFSWKGIGKTTIDAVQSLDLPVVMGATILIACIFVFINIFVDLIYAAIDPRVKLQ